ncbi:MAG TPA: hypothetical protein VH397_17470 [Xanthobacteraceae bacterium]|jgi:serine protease Do
MDQKSATPQVRAQSALSIAVLVCVIALAAAAGAIAARAVGSHEWRAAPPVPDRLAGRAGSGPASFADVVDEVKPAVIGVQARLAGNTDDRNVPGSPTDRSSPRSGAPQAAPPQPRRPGRIVTAQGSGFFISADGYAGRTERATADDADSSRSKM